MIDFLIILIAGIIALLSASITLFLLNPRKENKSASRFNKVFRYIPLVIVIVILIVVFIIPYRNSNQLKSINNTNATLLLNEINDSSFTNENKKVFIDSIKRYTQVLENAYNQTKVQEFIVGQNSNFLISARNLIEKSNSLIRKIESYNDIVIFDSLFKNNKGSMYNGNSVNIIFKCPENKKVDYLDLEMQFRDASIVKDVACISISILEKTGDKSYNSLFNESYVAKKGVNKFRINNFFNNKNTTLQIGYFLKKSKNEEYPRMEQITCKFNE